MDLSPAERSFVLTEFGRAKARVGFVLQAKLGCFESLPLKLLGLSHVEEAVAAQCAKEVADQVEELQRKLRAGGFQRVHAKIRFWAQHLVDLRELAAGRTQRRDLCKPLAFEIMRMTFVPLNETTIEGKHALAKCRMGRRVSSHPAPQLFSSELRCVEFTRRSQNPAVYLEMQEHFADCLQPLSVVRLFGMENHAYLERQLHFKGVLKQVDVSAAL